MTRFATSAAPRLSAFEQAAFGAFALGIVAWLSLPAARGMSEWFGWMPLWLLAMPLAVWCVLRASRRISTSARSASPQTLAWRSAVSVQAPARRRAAAMRRGLPRAA